MTPLNGIPANIQKGIQAFKSLQSAGQTPKIRTVDVTAANPATPSNTTNIDLDNFSPYVGMVNFSQTSDVREVNRTLAALGCNRTVSAAQVASVANGLNQAVLPGLEGVRNAATASHLTSVAPYDLQGQEFSEVFAS